LAGTTAIAGLGWRREYRLHLQQAAAVEAQRRIELAQQQAELLRRPECAVTNGVMVHVL